MLAFKGSLMARAVLVENGPGAARVIVFTTRHPAIHIDLAAERFCLFRACFPHHTGTFAWIFKRIDQRLDHFGAVFGLTPRKEGILNRAPEGKTFDPLRRPI